MCVCVCVCVCVSCNNVVVCVCVCACACVCLVVRYTGGINMIRVREGETNAVDTSEWSPYVIKLHSRAHNIPQDILCTSNLY